MKSGLWYPTNAPALSPGFQPFANDILWFLPMPVKSGMLLDRLGINISSPGQSGSLIRLGLYSDSDGTPGSLVADGDTVPGTVTAFVRATINYTTIDTLLWFAALYTAAPATRPSVDGSSGVDPLIPGPDANPERGQRAALYATGYSAFPTNAPTISSGSLVPNATGPRGFVRAN